MLVTDGDGAETDGSLGAQPARRRTTTMPTNAGRTERDETNRFLARAASDVRGTKGLPTRRTVIPCAGVTPVGCVMGFGIAT
jgi:hypothetical protein